MAFSRQGRPKYVYDLPYDLRMDICKIVELDGSWANIVAKLNYSTDQIIHWEKQPQPFDCFLKHWSQSCPTITDLFILLAQCNQIRAMTVIAHLVPPNIDQRYLRSSPTYSLQPPTPPAAAAAGPSPQAQSFGSQASIIDNRYHPAYVGGLGVPYPFSDDDQLSPGQYVYMDNPHSPHAASAAASHDLYGSGGDGRMYGYEARRYGMGGQAVSPGVGAPQPRPNLAQMREFQPQPDQHSFHARPMRQIQPVNQLADKHPAYAGIQQNQAQLSGSRISGDRGDCQKSCSEVWQQANDYSPPGGQMMNQGSGPAGQSEGLRQNCFAANQNQENQSSMYPMRPGLPQQSPSGDSRPRLQLHRTFSREPGEYGDAETPPAPTPASTLAGSVHQSQAGSLPPAANPSQQQGGSLRSTHVEVASMPSVPNKLPMLQQVDSITAEKEQARIQDGGFGCGMQFQFSEIQAATDNFDTKNLIGEGGFGKVYRGVMLGSTFAFKIIDKAKTISTHGADHLKMEMQALKMFQHPNIVTMSGFAMEESGLCLVFEYMPQGSLQDRLACKGDTAPLPWQTRYRILLDATSGLRYLHEAGVKGPSGKPLIHGDIKSANILLTRNLDAKLCDFGLAQEAASGEQTNEFTHVTMESREAKLMMTPAYYPPDFYQSSKLSTATDIYCMGVVMMEVCTGQRCGDVTRGKNLTYLKDYVWAVYGQPGGMAELQKLRDPNSPDWPLTFWDRLMVLALDCNKRIKSQRASIIQVMQSLSDLVKEIEKLQEMNEFPSPARTRPSQEAAEPYPGHRNPEINIAMEREVPQMGSYPGDVDDVPDEIEMQKRINRLAAKQELLSGQDFSIPAHESMRPGLSPRAEEPQPEPMLLQEYYDNLRESHRSLPNSQCYSPQDASRRTAQPKSLPNIKQSRSGESNFQSQDLNIQSAQNHMLSIGKKPSIEKDVEEMVMGPPSHDAYKSSSPLQSSSGVVVTHSSRHFSQHSAVVIQAPGAMPGMPNGGLKVVNTGGPSELDGPYRSHQNLTKSTNLPSQEPCCGSSGHGHGKQDDHRSFADGVSGRNQNELSDLQEKLRQQPGKSSTNVCGGLSSSGDALIPSFGALGINNSDSFGFSHGSSGLHQTMKATQDQQMSQEYIPNITQSIDPENNYDCYPNSLVSSFGNTAPYTQNLDDVTGKDDVHDEISMRKNKKVNFFDEQDSGDLDDNAAVERYDTQELQLGLTSGFNLK